MSRTIPNVNLQFCELENKFCIDCKIVQPAIKFSRHNTNKDKLHSYCKSCSSIRFSIYRNKNKNRLDEYRRNKYRENIEHEKNLMKLRRQNPDYKIRHAETQRRREALKKSGFYEKVDYNIVWVLHMGWCYLCKHFINKNDVQFDHVVPLSRGGSHSYSNIRPTHRSCNAKKWAKTPEEFLKEVSYV